jgi:signal transduction histidine kinase
VGGLAQAILDGDDAEALLAHVAQEARRLVSAKAAMVATVGGDPELLTIRAVEGASGGPLAVGSTRPLEGTPIEGLVRTGSMIVTSTADDVPPGERHFLEPYQVGPIVAVPIATQGVVRGVLFVAKAADAAPYRHADIAMIATFAQQAANAIDLRELRDAEARLTVGLERDRIARDLHDGVVQSLYGLGMSLRARISRSPDGALAASVTESLGRLDGAIAAVREYIRQLENGRSVSEAVVASERPSAARWSRGPSGRDVIAALGSLAEASSASRDLGSVLTELVDGVIERSQAGFCVLGTLTRDSQALEIRATGGSPVPARRPGDVVPLDQTLTAEALRVGRPVIVVTPEDAGPHISATLRAMATGPVVAVPMSIRGRAFGGLAVGRLPGSRPFSRVQVDVIEAHAVQAAIALEFDRVREEIRRAVVVQERRRVGQELHERVVQMLFGIGLTLQSLERTTRDAAMQRTLESAVDSIDRAIRDLRQYVFDLGPIVALDQALEAELRKLAGDGAAVPTLHLTLDIEPAVSDMVDGAARDILQVAREAVSNVVRHAGAEHCLVILRPLNDQIVLQIADDGRGVQDSSLSGRGLANIRARAAAIGGRVEIRPNRPKGTVVQLTVPIH